ncbi:MAG TPA: hypothetical protein VEV83_04015 [Parafilimonas sp.]|nr:hypothetical protein [Parafilimonas sp.]
MARKNDIIVVRVRQSRFPPGVEMTVHDVFSTEFVGAVPYSRTVTPDLTGASHLSGLV